MIVEVDGVRYDVPDDATPAEIDSISRPKVGRLEAAKRGAVQGLTLRLGDEIGGMATAGLTQPAQPQTTPGPRALARLHPGLSYADAASKWFAKNRPDVQAANSAETARQGQQSNYEVQRDAIRSANATAQQDHPWFYGGAEVVSGAVPALASSPVTGATLGARVLSGARSAAPVGAALGYGGSDEKTTGGQMLDTLIGGAGGALAGGALPVLGAAAAPMGKRLHSAAIAQGRKALSGIGTPLSARKEVPADVVEQALASKAIRPFGTVTGTAERLATQADEVGTRYAALLKELEARGVYGPEAEALASDLSQRAAQAAQTSLNSPRPGMLEATAEELRSKALPVAGKGRLGLMQAEEMKRGLQNEARREYDKITRQYTTTGETKKELASVMRQGIEDAVQQQASLAPDAAAAFEPVKGELSRTLGALRVAEEGAARAARRKPISLSSTIVGSAAGAAAGNPAVGLGAALTHGVMDSRLASALARAYYGGSKALASQAPTSAGQATAPLTGDEILQLIVRAMGKPSLAPAVAGEEGP